jgi:hypothetical protein
MMIRRKLKHHKVNAVKIFAIGTCCFVNFAKPTALYTPLITFLLLSLIEIYNDNRSS